MAGHVEIEEFITPARVEYAYGLAIKYQTSGKSGLTDAAMRAARARDPKLLKALEKGAEIIGKMSEAQMGQTRRSTEIFSHTKEHTESQLWREAYRMVDQGTPIENLVYIYLAGCFLAGIVA